MEIRQLSAFVAVATIGSFTRAAEQLRYAQSSVTSQIQVLENELGVKLFERLGKCVTLTAAGEKLLPYATRIIGLCEEAKNAVTPSDALKGTLVIGALESLCTARLLPLFKEFHSRFPDVEMTLKFGGGHVFLNMLKENQADIAFLIDHKNPVPEFICRQRWPEPLALLAAPEHPLAMAGRAFPTDLADQLLILSENGCSYRARLLKMLSDEGVAPKSTLESGNVEVMKQLAMSGLGITFLPRVAALDELADERLVELNWAGPAFGMATQIVHHKDKWVSPAMDAFLKLARELLPSSE